MDKNNKKPSLAPTVLSEIPSVDDKPISNTATNLKTGVKVNAKPALSSNINLKQKALTEIEVGFQTSSTEHGFLEAKNNADKALAENKIVLNNRFVLMETLGSGGMGTVYKAKDLRKVEARDNNPFVAAKILNSDFKNHPDAFISLQREASRSHLLSHPNIVTVHDFDRDEDTIFMTMELLKGEDLESYLSRYKNIGLEKNKALSLLSDFCTALDFAHKKGIIHSDLKPGNVFVCQEHHSKDNKTDKEEAKVLDFGIARLALESQNNDHFDAGTIGAITPAYASLEMIGREPPDARDDIFAAGIIAYELLTGTHPFNSLSAATALAKQLKPVRPQNLSNRQWLALSAALELKRVNRTKNIKDFLDGMTLVPKRPIYKMISLVLLSVISWFVYSSFFAPNELNIVIDETLLKANACYQQDNLQCALESANAILKMAPENETALLLLQQAKLGLIVHEIKQCLSVSQSIDCAEKAVKKLIASEPNHQKINEFKNEILIKKIEKLLQKANRCSLISNYQCAINELKAALELQPQHATALKRLDENEKALVQHHLADEKRQKDFNKLIKASEKCIKTRRFGCAVQQLKKALILKPASQKAQRLYQKSIFEKKQQEISLKKAQKIVNDGLECLAKFKYSCAIAKSESALDFVPNYKKALQLKKDATESQNNVKKTLTIE